MANIVLFRETEILQASGQLLARAALQTDCVNDQYLMVHHVLAEAFANPPKAGEWPDLSEYLSGRLTRQTSPAFEVG